MRPERRRRISYQGEHRVDIACLFDVEYVVRSLQHARRSNVAVTYKQLCARASGGLGGGGGGASNVQTSYRGGHGGSGIVIIRYKMLRKNVCDNGSTNPPCPTDGTFVPGCPCPAETHFGSPGAVVSFNPSSTSDESFTRVALDSKNVGETSWPLQTSSGFTLITKFKFTGTGAWFENVAYFGDAAQIGNIWLRRYGSGDKELLDFRIYQGSSGISTDSKCTIQSAAGSAPQNTVLNIIARWDGSVIELDINGVKASTDCSLVMQNRVLSETYIGSSFIDTSIGGFVDSSRFFLGDMYGMYAWPRHLSDSEAAQVLTAIEIGGPDTLPTLQCTSCPTNGDFVPTCPCPAETHFGSPGAVVAFNPSGNEATFVRSSSQQVDLGTVSYSIQTNGGFTVVAKFMFSGISRLAKIAQSGKHEFCDSPHTVGVFEYHNAVKS